MKNLDEKILKNFKNSIAMSHFEEELSMKKVFKKQIITLSILAVVIFSGGFLTVNAATNGEMVEDIKATIYNMLKDNTDIEVEKDSIEIYDEVMKLPEEMKTIIILRYYEDLPLAEIADVLQISLSKVKYRLYTALEKLRQLCA